ncbi:MAG: hypothetical protein JRI80_15675 [Deltaproteobacteria bacterium]|nr:hypothetical protein [Deltaproteobacteria bacterium]
MGQIIDISSRTAKFSDNLVTSGPLEFRQADWETAFFIQMLRSDSQEFEGRKRRMPRFGDRDSRRLPPHVSLQDGTASTIRAMFVYRDLETKMRDVYLLAGLIDCMINQVSPILRTALVRDMYKKIFLMKKGLGITWHGPLDQVLLPIDPRFFSVEEYQAALRAATTMKELYEQIRKGTEEMFDILSLKYVFYLPRAHASAR